MVNRKRIKYEILQNLNTIVLNIKKLYPKFDKSHDLFNTIKKNDSKWKNIDNQASKYQKVLNGATDLNKKLSIDEKLKYVKHKENHEPYLNLHPHNKLYQCYKTLRK